MTVMRGIRVYDEQKDQVEYRKGLSFFIENVVPESMQENGFNRGDDMYRRGIIGKLNYLGQQIHHDYTYHSFERYTSPLSGINVLYIGMLQRTFFSTDSDEAESIETY